MISVLRDGVTILDIQRAPVKSTARMLNKLDSAEDHKDKPMPRPKWNVDTVRAGIVVHDVSMIATVYEAIGAGVGRYLRVRHSRGYKTHRARLQPARS